MAFSDKIWDGKNYSRVHTYKCLRDWVKLVLTISIGSPLVAFTKVSSYSQIETFIRNIGVTIWESVIRAALLLPMTEKSNSHGSCR